MSTFNKYRLKGAYHYDWYETEDWYRYLIDRAVKFCKGKTVDVGCGDGLLLSKLPDGSIGVDKDRDGLRLCEEKGLKVGFTDLDVFDMDLTKEFEYIACLNTIEHLNDPGVLKHLIDQVSKGAIITTIDYQGGSFGEDHKTEYTMDQLVGFFKKFDPKPFRYKDTEWIGVEIKKCHRCINKMHGTRKITPVDVETFCNECHKEIESMI